MHCCTQVDGYQLSMHCTSARVEVVPSIVCGNYLTTTKYPAACLTVDIAKKSITCVDQGFAQSQSKESTALRITTVVSGKLVGRARG